MHDRYCDHYYKIFTKAIKLKYGYDLEYIIKYVWCEKNLTIAITS